MKSEGDLETSKPSLTIRWIIRRLPRNRNISSNKNNEQTMNSCTDELKRTILCKCILKLARSSLYWKLIMFHRVFFLRYSSDLNFRSSSPGICSVLQTRSQTMVCNKLHERVSLFFRNYTYTLILWRHSSVLFDVFNESPSSFNKEELQMLLVSFA